MYQEKLPIVLAGQVFFDDEKNDYLVVTYARGDVISYSGHGFKGMLDIDIFIDRFQPVDPEDLTDTEKTQLLSLCSGETVLKMGFIKD